MTIKPPRDPAQTVTHEITLHHTMDSFFSAKVGRNNWKCENKKDPNNADLVPGSI